MSKVYKIQNHYIMFIDKQMEIMQERRLIQDDNRGLGQGVVDNQPVLNIFKLILENFDACSRTQKEYPSGFLTISAHQEMSTLLHPMEKLIWHENDWSGVRSSYGADRGSLEPGLDIAVVRDLPHVINSSPTKTSKSSLGVVVHRNYLEECPPDGRLTGNVFIFLRIYLYLSVLFLQVNLQRLLNLDDRQTIYNSTLTLLRKDTLIIADEINLCPMDAKAFIIHR